MSIGFDKSINFTDQQLEVLKDHGFRSDLLVIEDDSVIYNGYYLCPAYRGPLFAYYCLKCFLLGFSVGSIFPG